MNTEPIQDFILKDAQNLRIALAISEAWPGTRERLVQVFQDKLSAKLLKELPGWETGTWEQFFEHGWASYHLFKANWADQYSVCLQANDSGGRMQYGIQRNDDLISDRPQSPEVLAAVRAIHPSARILKWWDAQVAMRTPASDWRTPEVLWLMYTDELFVDAVAEQMLAIARATETILDRLSKKK